MQIAINTLITIIIVGLASIAFEKRLSSIGADSTLKPTIQNLVDKNEALNKETNLQKEEIKLFKELVIPRLRP